MLVVMWNSIRRLMGNLSPGAPGPATTHELMRRGAWRGAVH